MKQGLNPFFIIGSPRSGTTLLRTMLSSHSEICIPHEFPLFGLLYDKFGIKHIDNNEVVAYLNSFSGFREWKIDLKKLGDRINTTDGSLNSIIHLIYNSYLDIYANDKMIWGDKNIGNTAYLFEIKQVFPSAKFIHIVRDVRDVALSLKERRWLRYKFRGQSPQYIKHLKGGVDTWLSALKFVDDFKKSHQSSVYELKYEDLVMSPEAALQGVSDFIGVSYDSCMLNYSKEAMKSISPIKMEVNHTNLSKPLITSAIKKYSTKLSKVEQATIIKLSSSELQRYNYIIDEYDEPNWFYKMWFNLTYQITRFKYYMISEVYSIYKNLK